MTLRLETGQRQPRVLTARLGRYFRSIATDRLVHLRPCVPLLTQLTGNFQLLAANAKAGVVLERHSGHARYVQASPSVEHMEGTVFVNGGSMSHQGKAKRVRQTGAKGLGVDDPS